MAAEQFLACSLKAVADEESSITVTTDGKVKTSSFYLDSTGRSSVSLPLKLQFPSKEALSKFRALTNISFDPPGTINSKETATNTKDNKTPQKSEKSTFTIGIEAKVTLTSGSGEAVSASVEGVNIMATKAEADSIYYETEILLLVARKVETGMPIGASLVKTTLEVAAALLEKKAPVDQAAHYSIIDTINQGSFKPNDKNQQTQRSVYARLYPLMLNVSLTHAFYVVTRSIHNVSPGYTLISLCIEHSNTHNKNINITNITLHPGHSTIQDSDYQQNDDNEVYDMSNNVRWSFAKDCSIKLPHTICPQDAVSTVIAVDASMDEHYHLFSCPLSVNATVGLKNVSNKHGHKIVAVSNVNWTTTQAAREASEAFCVKISLRDGKKIVGNAFVVDVEVQNLSTETRDIQLELVKASERGLRETTTDLAEQAKERKSNDLVPVDTKVTVGEICGNSSEGITLRFVPTKAGCHTLPSIVLLDRHNSQKYYCYHNFQVAVNDVK